MSKFVQMQQSHAMPRSLQEMIWNNMRICYIMLPTDCKHSIFVKLQERTKLLHSLSQMSLASCSTSGSLKVVGEMSLNANGWLMLRGFHSVEISGWLTWDMRWRIWPQRYTLIAESMYTWSVASADLQGIMSSDSLSPLADEVMCCWFEVCESEVSRETGQKQLYLYIN